MKNYEAVKALTPEQLVKFLDQVFLTGLNIGYQSLVDPDIYSGNLFDGNWANADVEGEPALVEDETGEGLIIEQLVNVVNRIMGFDVDSISEDISWQAQITLPKGMEDKDD